MCTSKNLFSLPLINSIQQQFVVLLFHFCVLFLVPKLGQMDPESILNCLFNVSFANSMQLPYSPPQRLAVSRSVTNSRGLRGSCGFVGLLRGFVSLKFKNPQTHIFKLRGFVGLAFKLM